MKGKPLASLCILFYKQEDFVEDTIKGALSQTYDNLEIIISDDNSPDGTFERIQKAVKDYNGPHKVILNRNTKNMGLVPHLNKVLFELSSGDLLFLNGGDDISIPDRVEKGVAYFTSQPDVTAVTFSRIVIDKTGKEIRKDKKEADSYVIVTDYSYLSSFSFMTGGVALSFRREVIQRFGPLLDNCPTDDSTWRFRAILMGKSVYSSHAGLKYRVHDNNITRDIFKLKTNYIAEQYLNDIEKAKDWSDSRLCDILKEKVLFFKKERQYDEAISKAKIIGRYYYSFLKKQVERNYKRKLKKNLAQ